MTKRRVLSCFLAALLAVSFSSCVLAFDWYSYQNSGNSSTSECSESSQSSSGDKQEESSSQSSSAGTGETTDEQTQPLDFTPTPATEQYGYRYFAENEQKREGLCAFYSTLVSAFSAWHASERDATEEDGVYRMEAVNYVEYGLTTKEATAVWKTVFLEYPEFFWLSNRVKYDDKKMYLLIAAEYATAALRLETQSAVEAVALDCAEYIDETQTETERALIVYDYLINKVDYAYEADGKTPQDDRFAHSIAGLALGSGVCETYAKAFDWLCGLFDVECASVSGEGIQGEHSGGHAWNIVKLEDEWRAVDATWGDRADDTIHREWFGVPATEFAKSHVPSLPTDEWGVEYQFGLPSLSEKRVMPVRASKNGSSLGVFADLDGALKTVTDEVGRYAFTLDITTSATQNKTLVVAENVLTATVLPKANGITLSGLSAATTKLNAAALSLQCDVTLKNLTFTASELTRNGYRVLPIGAIVNV